MSEQRPNQQWIVKVNGVEEVRLGPGESLEIGRKPLRPLADNGRRRLDVPDQTKSMSKRHALFSVSATGAGMLRDLGSTNGTYVVRDDGGLMRVPDDADFLLPSPTMRFQFGDVPVDCVRVEADDDETAAPAVPDLFSYASAPAVAQEPDAADMSVDDILDLRAGEPTGAFDASVVRSRIGAHAQPLAGTEAPGEAADQVQPVQPVQAAQPVQPAAQPVQSAPASLGIASPVQAPGAEAEQSAVQPQPIAQPLDQVTSPIVQPAVASAEPVMQPAVQPIAQPIVQPIAQPAVQPSEPAAQPVIQQPILQPNVKRPVVQPIVQPVAQQPAVQGRDLFADAISEVQSSAAPDVQDAQPQFQSADAQRMEADSQAAAQAGAQPVTAFEPGSVFERVKRGEFAAAQPVIEAGGHTSDQAKTTRDFAVQFDMARYPQLLPFLAMNPALYDDLYAWLAAQGDRDIDAALAQNDGYHDYLAAVRK